ncbi:MAG: sugar phosphate isomerase/epimerase [Candidatus Nealsonbacteria bacterium]|nr:sugar phosphate isomerase/epimerase [Candidatus Nealsonbacteria bacterium]
MLKLGAGAAVACFSGVYPAVVQAKPDKKKIPLGLQLYSVRNDCGKDLPGVIEAVGKMGYEGVEFAGYHGRTAEELRKLLDDNGLKCCGTHTGLNTLTGDALKGTVEFNKTLGNKFLIVPSLPGANRASARALIDTGKLFTELAAKVKDQGMLVGYHAHGGDFKKFDGTTGWDLIFDNASADVVMQMDIGNCIGGGGDPIATLKKYPGRSATVHLKEHGGKRGAAIGEGDVDWKTVFEICETTGGTEWYVVEQEGYNVPPLDSVRQCIDNLRKMGK